MRIDEAYVLEEIRKVGGLVEIDQAYKLILKYKTTDQFHSSKEALIAVWKVEPKDIFDFILSAFTAVLSNGSISYQALVGILSPKIRLEDTLDKVKICADLIGLISKTGLIDITSETGEYHMLTTEFSPKGMIPKDDKHVTITLRPQPVDSNWDSDGTGSVLLGDKMNHHTGYLRLSHLDRMGQVAFKINGDFVNQYVEAPKETPVGEKEEIQWLRHQEDALAKYEELMASDQRFFIQHKYDSRGRQYSGSYYINPQGSSFKKAVINLANTEVVDGF